MTTNTTIPQVRTVQSRMTRNSMTSAVAALSGAVLAAALLFTTTSALAQAQPSDERRAAMSARMIERMSSELNLTDAQQQEIDEIRRASRDANAADHERMRELRTALRNSEDDAERAAISDEIGQITGRLSVARASAMAAVQNVLTEEQRISMKAKRENRREQRKEAQGHRHGHGHEKHDSKRSSKPGAEDADRQPRDRMQKRKDKE